MTTFRQLENAWFEHAPRRAQDGRIALSGFHYQLARSLQIFFDALLTQTTAVSVSFEGLSDFSLLQDKLIYLVQFKRTLTRDSMMAAVKEFIEIDRFLEQKFPELRHSVCFRIAYSRLKPLSVPVIDRDWFDSIDAADRWDQIVSQSRILECEVRGDGRLELAVRLWRLVPRPLAFVKQCVGNLLDSLAKDRPSEEIAERLLADFEAVRIIDPKHPGQLLQPIDFSITDQGTGRVLIGERPRLEDLHEGCFMERPERVQLVSDMLGKAIRREPPFDPTGRQVPLVWISGGSGVGKSALLLQALRDFVTESDIPAIYLDHYTAELPEAIESVGQERALIAIDDLYSPNERSGELWNKVHRLLHSAPNIILLACGPEDYRSAFAGVANQHGVIKIEKVPCESLTIDEQGEYFRWFSDRTGAMNLRQPAASNFVIAAFTLARARAGDASLEQFASRFRQRLDQLGLSQEVLVTLAVNRLGIRPPFELFRNKQDALARLKEDGLVSIVTDSYGTSSVSFHRQIGQALYDIYRPAQTNKEARAQDIAWYFQAIIDDSDSATALLDLLAGKRSSKQVLEPLATDALTCIWRMLVEHAPPDLKLSLMIECKAALMQRKTAPLTKIIQPGKLLTWAKSPHVDAPGQGILWQIVWDVLAPHQRDEARAQILQWLDRHVDLPQWNFLWQLLWPDFAIRVELTDLAQRWLEIHTNDSAWNRVFQKLFEANIRHPWLAKNAIKALTEGPSTAADVEVWLKVKEMTKGTDHASLLPRLLLVRLCKSIRPDTHRKGIVEFQKFGTSVDIGLVTATLEDYGNEPGASYAFQKLCPLLPSLSPQALSPLLQAGRAWLAGRDDKPEWNFVWQRLLELAPNDTELRAIGRAWLAGREDKPEWSHVWQRLLELAPNDTELRAIGRAWLAGRDDKPEWSHVWRRLLELAPNDTELRAIGRAWLAGREDKPEWAYVWRGLVKADPESRELLQLGTSFYFARVSQVELRPVYRVVRAESARFWRELPENERRTLLHDLIVEWTHSSTAIEGNTYTLGETRDFLERGITINGKPLKDHREIAGHKRAIDILLGWLDRNELHEHDLFEMHAAVLDELVIDIMSPIGSWKRQHNFVQAVSLAGKPVTIEFAPPELTPGLMAEWIKRLNPWLAGPPRRLESALGAFLELHVAFVRIHPFFDGNGRMARLLANLPLLKAGFPPLLVPKDKRDEYKQLHTEYDLVAGPAHSADRLFFEAPELEAIRVFLREAWHPTLERVGDRVIAYWRRSQL